MSHPQLRVETMINRTLLAAISVATSSWADGYHRKVAAIVIETK
jgi:hypothetical protein